MRLFCSNLSLNRNKKHVSPRYVDRVTIFYFTSIINQRMGLISSYLRQYTQLISKMEDHCYIQGCLCRPSTGRDPCYNGEKQLQSCGSPKWRNQYVWCCKEPYHDGYFLVLSLLFLKQLLYCYSNISFTNTKSTEFTDI